MLRRLGTVSTSFPSSLRCLGGVEKIWRYSTKTIDALEEKKSKALVGGGEKRVAKQHKTVQLE